MTASKKSRPARPPRPSVRDVTRKIWRDRISYLFVAPYVVLFAVFTVAPVVIAIVFSFTNFNILEPPQYAGLGNYTRLFMEDDIFLLSLKNTLIFAVITGPVSYILCFIVAWFINELSPKIRAIVTLIFYAPSISGNLFFIWSVIFSGDSYGYANGVLLKLGLISEPIQFFTNTNYMLPLCVIIVLWMSLGVSFLAFIAGFQGLDKSLFEAGAVDGIKNRWQELYYITLPSMKSQLRFSAVMSITASFGIGQTLDGLVGFPSTEYATHTVMNHLIDYGTIRFEMGYACAIATLLFIVMVASNLVVKRIISKVGE